MASANGDEGESTFWIVGGIGLVAATGFAAKRLNRRDEEDEDVRYKLTFPRRRTTGTSGADSATATGREETVYWKIDPTHPGLSFRMDDLSNNAVAPTPIAHTLIESASIPAPSPQHCGARATVRGDADEQPPPIARNDHEAQRQPRRWRGSLSAVVTTVGLLLAGLCFWQGLPALTGTGHRATASTLSQSGGRELITTPIEELVPLDRVIAENPELAGQHVPQRTIDPRIDRLVSFTQTHPDGSITEWTRVERLPELLIGLLLADETAFDDLADDASDAAFAQSLIGRTVDVELSDLGASGPATILNVAPCPEPEADDGTGRRLVTAVFRHTSSNIVDVTLDDGTPSIGSTGNHPYWSEDRQAYIRAEELRPRERLRKVNDTFCRVASVTKRHLTEPVTVYNVEVDGQHVYFVGDSGVLVHNLCTQTWDTSSNSKILRKNLGDMVKKGEEAHHIVASTHRRADKARKLLGRYGIDINSADNGVGLANGLHHGNGLHSYKGIDEVLRRLKTAEKHAKAAGGNCSQALKDELKAMADEMRIRQFQIPN